MELIIKRVLTGAVIFIFMVASAFIPSAVAQSAQQAQDHDDAQDAGTPVDDKAWEDDMTGKIDTTIKVLYVIRDEVEEAEKERLSTRDDDTDSSTAMARSGINRINRAWRNMMKATEDDEAVPTGGKDPQKEPDVIDTGAISGRLSAVIDMMSSIREELEKEQKKEKEEEL